MGENGGVALANLRWLATPISSPARAAQRYHSLLPLGPGSTRGSVSNVPVAPRSPVLIAEASMPVMIERVAGLDVHQETVVACVLIGKPGERPTKEVRTFRTMTRDLEALREWLLSLGVTHVGMESTGIYWKPVYAVLEGSFELIVGNARHIRNVSRRGYPRSRRSVRRVARTRLVAR